MVAEPPPEAESRFTDGVLRVFEAEMLKQAAVVIFLAAPVLALAECGFVNSGNEMTIVVSRNANNKCFASENFREAFRSNLVASVNAMEGNAPPQHRARPNVPPGERRPAVVALPVQQAVLYYGQDPRR